MSFLLDVPSEEKARKHRKRVLIFAAAGLVAVLLAVAMALWMSREGGRSKSWRTDRSGPLPSAAGTDEASHRRGWIRRIRVRAKRDQVDQDCRIGSTLDPSGMSQVRSFFPFDRATSPTASSTVLATRNFVFASSAGSSDVTTTMSNFSAAAHM